MANQLFGGFLYTDAGVAIVGATADLFDRNTTTPVRATTTTDANGYWAISYATEGRFDVRTTNGTSIRWRKYDTEEQFTTIEVATLRVRNPADTFDYDIVPGAITADRQLNLPVITGTDTVAVLSLAQTLSNKTLSAPTITASDWANATHGHTSAATGGAISIGVSRAGGNTTEATTTSTTAVDLLSVASLSITAATPMLIVNSGRKSSGAAAAAACGLKLNTTVTGEAVASVNTGNWLASATNQAEDGVARTWFGSRVTNYLEGGAAHSLVYPSAAGTPTSTAARASFTANAPTATITDVVIRGISGDAAVTLASDECHVYTLATS